MGGGGGVVEGGGVWNTYRKANNSVYISFKDHTEPLTPLPQEMMIGLIRLQVSKPYRKPYHCGEVCGAAQVL